MKKFNEFSFGTQLAMMIGVAAALVLAGEFLYLNDISASNRDLTARIEKQKQENDKLRPFEARLNQLKAETTQLELQLANLKTIVPEEKELDDFIRLIQEAAVQTGVNIRRIEARAQQTRDFYVEVPFEINLDGNYYAILQYYDRLSRQSRIINVSNLAIAPVTGTVRGGRRYAFGPNDTVVAACTVTTFFSREATAATPVKR